MFYDFLFLNFGPFQLRCNLEILLVLPVLQMLLKELGQVKVRPVGVLGVVVGLVPGGLVSARRRPVPDGCRSSNFGTWGDRRRGQGSCGAPVKWGPTMMGDVERLAFLGRRPRFGHW